MTLNVAFNYSSRTELVDAVQRCIADGLAADDVTEAAIDARLYTAGMPEPDLLIRTGGDQRVSNFLLWQAAYAELYFCDRYWPDFDRGAYDEALGGVRPAFAALRALTAGRGAMQQRLISSLVMVPVVVGVFLLGMPWLGLGVGHPVGHRRDGGVQAAGRRRLPGAHAAGGDRAAARGAGHGLGGCAAREALQPWSPVCSSSPPSTRSAARTSRKGSSCWVGTSFGALYASLLAFVVGVITVAPTLPAGRAAVRLVRRRPHVAAGAGADRLELRHLRLPLRAHVQAGPVPQPHLAQQDVERRHRRHGRRDRRGHDRSPGARASRRSPARCWVCSSRSLRSRATSRSRCSSAPPARRTPGTLIPGHGGILDRDGLVPVRGARAVRVPDRARAAGTAA